MKVIPETRSHGALILIKIYVFLTLFSNGYASFLCVTRLAMA